MRRSMPTTPDPAESAMLGIIAEDMLSEAGKRGHAECTFRQYRILARRLSHHRWRLVIGDKEGTLLDTDIDADV